MDIRDVIKAGNTAIEAIDLVKDYGSGSNAVPRCAVSTSPSNKAGSPPSWDRPAPANPR